MDFLAFKYSPDDYFDVAKEDLNNTTLMSFKFNDSKWTQENVDRKEMIWQYQEKSLIRDQSQEKRIDKFMSRAKARQKVNIWRINKKIKL